MIQYGSLAGSQLSCRAGSPRALLWLSCQAGNRTVRPARAVAVFQVWQPSSAYQFSPIFRCVHCRVTPDHAAVSFAPVFTAAPVGLDPVVAALSQVGPVCGQTAIVPLVNPAVPPAADLLGGPVAIPGWGSLPPRLTKKSWLWNTWTCGSFCRSHGAWSRQRVVAAIPVARGMG